MEGFMNTTGNKKNNFKKERYQEMVLQEVNLLLRTKMSDARLQRVTITKVELTADYSIAKLYWDVFDSTIKVQVEKAIVGVAPKIRSMLATILKVRHTPQIHFLYDAQFESEHNIIQILQEEVKLGKNY